MKMAKNNTKNPLLNNKGFFGSYKNCCSTAGMSKSGRRKVSNFKVVSCQFGVVNGLVCCLNFISRYVTFINFRAKPLSRNVHLIPGFMFLSRKAIGSVFSRKDAKPQ